MAKTQKCNEDHIRSKRRTLLRALLSAQGASAWSGGPLGSCSHATKRAAATQPESYSSLLTNMGVLVNKLMKTLVVAASATGAGLSGAVSLGLDGNKAHFYGLFSKC